MALTDRMQEELEYIKESQQMRNEEYDRRKTEMGDKTDGPLKTDPRVIAVFGTGSEFTDRDFVKAYVSGQPEKREPYLTDLFDELQNFRWNPDITSGSVMESNLASIVDHSKKFCYLQNLISDNKDYYEEHFPNPQDRIALEAAVDMSTSITPLISHVLAENNYEYSLEERPREEVRLIDTKASAMLRAQTAEHVYRQQMDTLEGRTADHTLNLRFNEGINRSLCFIGKDLEKARKQLAAGKEKPDLRTDLWTEASSTFDSVFDAISPGSSQGKEQTRLGLDQFDMIYIDGKSVREACSGKYRNASPAELNKLMKGEVIHALTSGRNRVELATVQRDKDNHAHLSISSVEPDIRAIEPTVKEDYSAIRRIFNRGPFRCKTRTERLETLKSADEGKEARQAAMAENFRVKIQRLNQQADKDAKNRALGASASQRIKAHEILASLKAKSEPRRTFPSTPRRTPAKQYNHEDYFGSREFWGKDENNQDIKVPFDSYIRDPIQKEGFAELGIAQFKKEDVYAAIDIMVLGNKDRRVSLKQLADNPPGLTRLRRKEAADLLSMSQQGEIAYRQNARIYARAGARICCQPLPDISSPEALAENYPVLETMEAVTRTWSSTQQPFIKYEIDDRLKGSGLITPDRIRETIGFMKTWSQSALSLSHYYMSPASLDPDARLTGEMHSALAGKAALDALQAAAPGEGLNPRTMDADQSKEYRQIMEAAGKAAREAASKRKNSEVLMSYLRGDGPNPFRRDEAGSFVFEAPDSARTSAREQTAEESKDRQRSSLDGLMSEEKPSASRRIPAEEQRTKAPQPASEREGAHL